MRVLIVIAVYLSFFLFSVFAMASGYSLEDEQFKNENIDELKPYGTMYQFKAKMTGSVKVVV